MLKRSEQAQFRPLVKQAWHCHCESMSILENDPAAFDAWYRDFLFSTCHIRSTKEATSKDLHTLLEAIMLLIPSSPVNPPQIFCWSEAQNVAFADLVRKAYSVAVHRGCTTSFDQWFSDQSRAIRFRPETTNRIHGFDRIMLHLATIAGDMGWMSRLTAADERRMRWWIRNMLDEISRMTGTKHGWDYVKGVWNQAEMLPADIQDAPADQLRSVLAILDTYRRRLKSRPAAR